MSIIKVNQLQRRALALTTALAVVLGIYFLHFYFMLIAFAAIVAFVSNPLYQWFLNRWGRPQKAAWITLLCVSIIVAVPVTIVLFITVHQVINLADTVKNASQDVNLNNLMQSFINSFNNILSSLNIDYQLTEATLRQGLSEALKNFGESILAALTTSLSSFISFFTIAIIYMYVFVSMLINQDKIMETIRRLNPLGDEVSELYMSRTGAMTKAMVRGQFIIAATQGITDSLFLYLAGFHNLFFFFCVILTALSIIPLGGGIVVIPIGIILILTGNIWQGALVLAGHFIVVTNEDNIMRPKLVPKQARLDPALTLLAVFSGLKFFGFLGIIIGPVIMILLVTTFQVFNEVFHNIESIDRTKYAKNKRRFFNRIKFWKKA